jgi:ADP-ribose pyrophosphatase YjhB (NUDIX family)
VGLLTGWKLCPQCGSELRGDAARLECARCRFVAYANSVPGAEVILHDTDHRLLLVRRAFPPGAGLWDLPGGFLHEGEHPIEGLRREVREETGLDVEALEFLDFYLEPYDGRIVLCLTWTGRATGQPRAADDVSELRWFRFDELPAAHEFAFPHDVPALSAAVARHEHP